MNSMTSEQSKLLSAYVDGEVSPRQREAAERLVEQSPVARRLLRKLRLDAAQIRTLPRKKLDADFAEVILERIGEQAPVRKVTLAEEPMHRGAPIWVGLATAAAVLLAVSAGSYWYFNETADPSPSQRLVASKDKADNLANKEKKDRVEDKIGGDSSVAKNDKATPTEKDASTDNGNSAPIRNPKESTNDLNPRDTQLASPVPEMEMFQPKVPNVSLGKILSLHQLQLDEFKSQLKAGQTVRLELPCRETAKAFAKVDTAFKASKIDLLIDQIAQARLKLPKVKTNYVFFVEDVTQDELIKLLQHLSAEDKRVEGKQKADPLFDKLLVDPMSEAHHKQLSQLLGVDPRSIPMKPKTPLGLDPKKPLSETTGAQVVQNLTGQGGTPRPDPNKPAAKPGEHLALALAYNPVRPFASSPEVKRFLESRKPGRSGTIQVLLVLRGT
jgi:hypothetical protein